MTDAADTATPQNLRLIGMAAAGHGFNGIVGAGEAVAISTGAPLPEGADTILIKENTETGDGIVIAREPAIAGRHIRRAGFDFKQGDVLLEAGHLLNGRAIALAGAMNHAALPVRRRPRIAIIATGDELVAPGATPGPDQIVASSGVGLAAFARASGAEPHDFGIVRDDSGAIEAAIDRAVGLPADILITLGGASVGDHDLVQSALTARGMELGFWRIAMRPGKPLIFGAFEKTRVLGLPGNPVSSMVCALLFLRPLISAMLGRAPSDPTEAAILGGDLGENDQRQDYLRASLVPDGDGLPRATAFARQDSSNLSILAAADCLIVRPPHAPAAKAGNSCRIIRFDF